MGWMKNRLGKRALKINHKKFNYLLKYFFINSKKNSTNPRISLIFLNLLSRMVGALNRPVCTTKNENTRIIILWSFRLIKLTWVRGGFYSVKILYFIIFYFIILHSPRRGIFHNAYMFSNILFRDIIFPLNSHRIFHNYSVFIVGKKKKKCYFFLL